jgi:hypothetical protein
MDWLKQIAPTIATVLGGPLAGMAVEAIGSAFGMTDATQDKIKDIVQSGNMTGEQIAAVKQAEIALQAKLKELDIDVEKVHAGDRDSARKMQIETKSLIPGALALLVTFGFFGILVGMMRGLLVISENQALLIMLGALGTAWGSVVNYYFGSSASSDAKTQLLARSPAIK